MTTIKAVAGGATILPAMLTKSLFTQIVESVLKSGSTVPDHAIRLTKREREIIDLISEGMSNKEIAQQLHIATFTVKSHVHNVLESSTSARACRLPPSSATSARSSRPVPPRVAD